MAVHIEILSSVYYSSMSARARARALGWCTPLTLSEKPSSPSSTPSLCPLLLFLFLCPGERYAELQPASAPHHRARVTESRGGGGVGPAVYPGTTRRPHIPSPFPFPTPFFFLLYSPRVFARFQPLFLCSPFFFFSFFFLFPEKSTRRREMIGDLWSARWTRYYVDLIYLWWHARRPLDIQLFRRWKGFWEYRRSPLRFVGFFWDCLRILFFEKLKKVQQVVDLFFGKNQRKN